MLNDMWCEWKDLAIKRKLHQIASKSYAIEDPWFEKEDIVAPYG